MDELQLRLLEKGTMKNVIALNLYIGINVLVYERRLMVKVWSMTKFVLKKHFLQKQLYFL